MVDKLLHARKALQPFAAILEGNLAEIGGGTLIRSEITVQMVKDAHAALVLIDQPHPQLRTTDTMKHAIAELEIALHTAETNEPIHRAEGNFLQATITAERAADLRGAISVLRRHEDRIGYNAGLLYDAYCAAVGGVAFNGDPLPDWQTFRADPAKQKQSDAWIAVARAATGEPTLVPAPEDPYPRIDWGEQPPEVSFGESEQPTTIRGWLETLPDGYRERALANTDARHHDAPAEDLGDAIACAFDWQGSPEGIGFWSTIRHGKGFPPLPEPA